MSKMSTFWLIVTCIVCTAWVRSDEGPLIAQAPPSPTSGVASEHHAAAPISGFTSHLDAHGILPEETRFMTSVANHFRESLPFVVGDDTQAQMLLSYYRSEAMFARPRLTGMIIGLSTEGTRTGGTLPIVIIDTTEAAQLGDPGAVLSGFRYRPDMRSVLMSPQQMTTPWEESILLHELWHAYSDLVLHTSAGEERFWVGDNSFMVGEESVAHALQYRLLNRSTSGGYSTALDQLARARIMRGETGEIHELVSGEVEVLNSLFLPASELEQTYRYCQYEIDLSVAMARISGSDENDARQAELRILYTDEY